MKLPLPSLIEHVPLTHWHCLLLFGFNFFFFFFFKYLIVRLGFDALSDIDSLSTK